MANGLEKQEQEEQPWRILEFYSGIGGMMYSLVSAGVNAEVVEAFDINDTANDVYQHNFGHRPYQGNIQSLTAADLDCYGGRCMASFSSLPTLHSTGLVFIIFVFTEVWQRLKQIFTSYLWIDLHKQSGDARAFSFLNILELIPHTHLDLRWCYLWKMLSDLRSILGSFIVIEFILSLLQFGVPYSRPRYFCLAKRRPSTFYNQVFDNQLLRSLGPLFGDANADETVFSELDEPQEIRDVLLESCEPIESFLEFKNCSDQSEVQFWGHHYLFYKH